MGKVVVIVPQAVADVEVVLLVVDMVLLVLALFCSGSPSRCQTLLTFDSPPSPSANPCDT